MYSSLAVLNEIKFVYFNIWLQILDVVMVGPCLTGLELVKAVDRFSFLDYPKDLPASASAESLISAGTAGSVKIASLCVYLYVFTDNCAG